MRKITKRITALIIAAIMLASMIPAAFATTGEESVKEKYEFIFTNGSHGYDEDKTVLFDKTNVVNNFTLNGTVSGDKWGYVSAWHPNTATAYANRLLYSYSHTSSRAKGYVYNPDESLYPGFLALEIVIDQPGTYTPSLEWVAMDTSPYVDLYLVKAPTDATDVAFWEKVKLLTIWKDTAEITRAGCYDILKGVNPLGTVKMQPTSDDGDVSGKVAFSTVTITKNDTGSYYLMFVPNGASENVAAKLATSGTYCSIQPTSFSLTRVEEDAELTDAFDDAVTADAPNDYIAPTVDYIDATGIVGTPAPQADGSYKIEAAAEAGDRGEFLYWKKAMSLTDKIVSFERAFNYVPESKGRNILVAVYEGDITSTSPKCYNANGQYLPDAQPDDEYLPSMAGYGKANAWEQYGNTNVYVAQYEAETPIADIDVTVIGDNTSGGGTNLAYGAEVTCIATGENFKCWKKTYGDDTAKIVSTDAEYTFNAWEDCTVEAKYEENVTYTGSKLKIIIDSFVAGEETGVMAEFLGLGNNVVEKGIMFTDSEENDNRIAMTTVGNQFSVIADENGTYKGYVIVEEKDGLKLITDGEYEKSAE